jgi:hypothetical protein
MPMTEQSPGGEWGDFEISSPAAKKDYRKLVFLAANRLFFWLRIRGWRGLVCDKPAPFSVLKI